MLQLDQLQVLLLGALLAVLVVGILGALFLWVVGSWVRSWLSGFDGLNAKRVGGKLAFGGVLVDRARQVQRRHRPRAKARPVPRRNRTTLPDEVRLQPKRDGNGRFARVNQANGSPVVS